MLIIKEVVIWNWCFTHVESSRYKYRFILTPGFCGIVGLALMKYLILSSGVRWVYRKKSRKNPKN